jgi:hypothetical protein
LQSASAVGAHLRFGARIALGSCEPRNTKFLEGENMTTTKPIKKGKTLSSKKIEKKVPLMTLAR